MRIAFVTDGLFPLQMGGMERHSTMFCNELAKSEEVSLTVYAAGSRPEQIPEEIEFSPIFVPIREQFYPKQIWDYSHAVNQLLAKEEWDLIYCQGLNAINIRNRAPVIYNPHGPGMFQTTTLTLWAKTAPLRWMAKKCFESSTKVICLGGRLRDVLLRNGCPEDKILEEPNGINISYIESIIADFKDLRPLPKRFFFVGRLAALKGILILLKAFRKLSDSTAQLVIGGAGSLEENLKAECARDSRIIFLGKLEASEVYRQLVLAEALVFSSHFDGMPTVLMEAFACQRPVIATDVGAVGVIVKEGMGILVKPNDVKALTRAMEQFLSFSKHDKQTMGLAGYRHVASHFNWPAIVQESLKTFEQLVELKDYSMVH